MLASQTVNFMLALPQAQNPNQPAPIQGAMDCVTANPSEAAQAYYNITVTSIRNAMLALRQQTLVPALASVTV